MLTQYAFSILFIDKKKAKFSNDRFGFISPALYESEKKYSVQVAAVIYLLFILGVLVNKNTPRINRQSNVSN